MSRSTPATTCSNVARPSLVCQTCEDRYLDVLKDLRVIQLRLQRLELILIGLTISFGLETLAVMLGA